MTFHLNEVPNNDKDWCVRKT